MPASGLWEPSIFYAFDLRSKHLQMEAFDLDQAAGIRPSIKRTTKIINLDIRRAVWRSCYEWVAGVNPAMGLPITASLAVRFFLRRAEGGQYARATYLRYRTALLAELGVWSDRCADSGVKDDCTQACALLIEPDAQIQQVAPGEWDIFTLISHAEKRIGRHDLNVLQKALGQRKAAGRRVLCFVNATLATGLRPAEWNEAWLDTENKLHVKRAKVHQKIPAFQRTRLASELVGRRVATVQEADDILRDANAEIPDLELEEMRVQTIAPNDLAFVSEHLANVAAARVKTGRGFKKFQDACTKYLNRICREIWSGDRSYAFYSFRHQFAANSKRVMPLDQVEVDLGSHSATKYAKRALSWRGLAGAGDYHAERREQREIDAKARKSSSRRHRSSMRERG
jgi:hypothetical protein